MIYIPPDSNDFCVDCKVDTILIGEYYSVYPEVWANSKLGSHDGMLCISCLENRIGRILTSEDFTDFPINTSPMHRSALLADRMSIKVS